jgi:hypothetical protein
VTHSSIAAKMMGGFLGFRIVSPCPVVVPLEKGHKGGRRWSPGSGPTPPCLSWQFSARAQGHRDGICYPRYARRHVAYITFPLGVLKRAPRRSTE